MTRVMDGASLALMVPAPIPAAYGQVGAFFSNGLVFFVVFLFQGPSSQEADDVWDS